MRRFGAILVLLVVFWACRDDHVALRRGPLGPASYVVEVDAKDVPGDLHEHRLATLRIDPREGGAGFALRTQTGEVIRAELRRQSDGSVNLEGVSGIRVDRSRQAELASLVGQLTPPLPRDSVRLGERWSSTQRIRTQTLSASLRTQLAIARFRRIAATDTAELRGTVRGRLRTTGPLGVVSGTLQGDTRIAWAVVAGRVVEAETKLVWTLRGGERVTLETRVRPR
jgi:hypothetical protein